MILATPGPTPVRESVRIAMAGRTIHHRTPEFEAIFAKTRELMGRVLGMKENIMLSSSGTGAMEACITNLCKKKCLTVNAGKFGERFGKIARAFAKEVVELTYPWDTPALVDDILNALDTNPEIDSIFIQVCESSGGLRHPVEEIAKAVKSINTDIVIVCDGITAVGVEPIDTTHIDALIAGSQKAFMLPPGLSMIGLSELALERIDSANVGYYFNLKTELKNQQKNTTAYTPATTLIIGLKTILEEIFALGLDEFYAKTARRSSATKKALEAIGLKIYPKSPAPSMTVVNYRDNADKLRKIMQTKYSLNVAGGQDMLKGHIVRISQMGLIEDYEASWAVNALEKAICEFEGKRFEGKANAVFMEEFYK